MEATSGNDDRTQPVQFVSAFHVDAVGCDDGVDTPAGFQDSPDQWYSANNRKRGASGGGLGDAATLRDSQATQPQSAATQLQSMATQPMSYSAHSAPSFVNATGSLSDEYSERRDDDADEDETQIMMSFSQDRDAIRLAARRIEEEELQLSLPGSGLSPTRAAVKENDINNSDTESDMSDDMLEQDGHINGLSTIAASFQQQTDAQDHLTTPKKAPVHVYKPRGPFQISPPASVAGDVDDSSGGETEVEEEPEITQTFGSARSQTAREESAPATLSVSVKKVLPPRLSLGTRSVSENNVVPSEDKRPKRFSLERALSSNDIDSSPERNSRHRMRAEQDGEGRPPRPTKTRLKFEQEQNETVTVDVGIPSMHLDMAEEESPSKRRKSDSTSRLEAAGTEDRAAMEHEVEEPKPTPTPQSSRKRKLSSQSRSEESAASSSSPDVSMPDNNCSPSIRIMFTGLDGTLAVLREKVKKIKDAAQEDDDVDRVTHLVAPKNQLKRTVKLLCGVSCCDHILDERWLDASARSGKRMNEVVHCLKDAKAESKWNFSLYRTMYEVPKARRRVLFNGLKFFITNHKSILPPVKDLVKIVECAGGIAETKGIAQADDIVITSDAAIGLSSVKKLLAQASSSKIYTPELILSSILQQRIDFDANHVDGCVSDRESPARTKRRAKR